MDNVMNLLPFFIAIAIVMTVVFTELVKLLDRKDRLKGYRVYIPLALSFVFAWILRIGDFFAAGQMWFWWAAVFGFSVFGYEAVLRKIQNALNAGEKKSQ